MGATVAARNLIRIFKEARQKKSILQRIREYSGYISIKYESDDFLVTTVRSGPELLKVLELRHEVFVEEWQGRKAFHGLDVDNFDFCADHLMIVDKRIDEIIGTYRLLSSHFTHNFYSSSEFGLKNFLYTPTVKLEMGRACIHSNYRNGNTIDLLWKGLARYIDTSKTEFLFGCSSLKSMDSNLIGRFYKSLDSDGYHSDQYCIRATEDYTFPGFSFDDKQPLSALERREITPPLLRSYLHAGAKVYGYPALDRDFECIDLLTILDWSCLNPRFKTHFLG